ncbi:MAG: acyl-CoA dehydrogenase family protein [Deltaproteobacteria bacterium]|nr:acyl-CoA dehydrogenase family protein [Deltaproteobacteria bacterium]
MDDTTPTSPAPSADALIERAKALVPSLLERAPETERLGHIHPESIKELKENGLFRICQPKLYGGYEMSYTTLLEIAIELGRGCCSTGWVFENNAMHNLILSSFSKEMQDEFWGNGHAERLCATGWSSFHSKLVPVEGGYRATGHWEFNSGMQNCDAVMVLAPVEGRSLPGGIPEMRFSVMYKDSGDFEILDSWDVVGLVGTGSTNCRAEDVFIPEHRTMAAADGNRHAAPGERVPLQGAGVHDSAWYRVPLFTYFPQSVAPCLIGAAEGALEHTLERLETRTNLVGMRLDETQAVQLRLAEAATKIECARSLHLGSVREMEEYAARWEEPDELTRGRWHGNAAYSAKLAYEVVSSLFYRGGAHGIYNEDRLARIYRDVGAGVTHLATDWEMAGSIYGKALLGISTQGIPLH